MSLEVNQISNIVDLENFSPTDTNLLTSKDLVRSFGAPDDYIEMHIYSPDGTLLSSDYNFKGYGIPSTTQGTTTTDLIFNPNDDVLGKGYLTGTFNVQYNILKHRITTGSSAAFFIKEISTDRTEIRVSSNILSNNDLESNTISFISDIVSSPYFKDFLLDFGSNSFLTAVNIALDKSTTPYSLLLKLYQPLPSSHAVNDSFWIVEELSNSYTYEVILVPDNIVNPVPMIKGPNFDLDIDHLQIPPTQYYNYNSILGTLSSGSYRNLVALMNKSGVQLNIDYTDYSNFVHFSSAQKRILNFYSKVKSIESYNSQIQTLSAVTSSFSVSRSISLLQSNINDVIQNFDGYDNYLYSVSSSKAWPKSNATLPYVLYPTTSSQVINWMGSNDTFSTIFGGQMYSSSVYDQENQNNLIHSIPEYLLLDDSNAPLQTFYQMIGQHFDSIWTYTKAAGDIYKANNSLTQGISKDLVYHALKSMGIKLYNNHSNQSLVEWYTGRTPSGSYLPVTSSYETLITASQYTIAGQDQVKEIFKRIYHNVPYLLKTKGTDASFRALSSLYGVPSTIFRSNEYGGVDKQTDTIEYEYDRFSYALYTKGTGSFTAPWSIISQSYTTLGTGSFPSTIEFRFKPDVNSFVHNPTQSLFFVGNEGGSTNIYLLCQYSQSNGLPYANITFGLNGSSGFIFGPPMSLPIFVTGSDGDTRWWNVMIKKRFLTYLSGSADWIDFDGTYFIDAADSFRINTGYGNTLINTGSQFFDVFIKNQINGKIGHQASSSIFVNISASASYNRSWDNNSTMYVGGSSNTISPVQQIFVGKLQEVRIWNGILLESAFNWHVLNPESIEGNFSSSYYYDLSARFPLGNNLYTYDHSITTMVAPTQPAQYAFFPSASLIHFGTGSSYVSNYETYYANVPIAGYSNPVTNKIRITSNAITGSVISNYIRLEQPISSSLTKDLHIVNAAFSPQNEIDQDIISAMGATIDLDDYIGDPADETRDVYANLDILKAEFFNNRYATRYNFNSYIRLIKYFNNTLFKTLQDFIAGRANLETGVTIRPTLIERAKVKRYNPAITNTQYTSSIRQIPFQVNNVINTRVGDNRGAYTGELSGSWINDAPHLARVNRNPYLLGDGTADLNFFPGSAFDSLYGNVSHNVTSSVRRKVDYNGNLIDMEVQDSYYTNLSQIRARYEGSKTTSQFYNTYSLGDVVYDKNAAISANSLKFAWIKQINSTNLNFVDKTTISIKYLVDKQGSLTDLSRHNFNLFEVQNTFKSGTPTIVSLSDVTKPSNQTALDGDKMIFEGGFSYWPLVFRESGENMKFNYLNSLVNSGSINITMIQTSSIEYLSYMGADAAFQNLRQIDMDTSLGGYTLTLGGIKVDSGEFSLGYIAPFSSWSYASKSDLLEGTSIIIGSGSLTGTFPGETDANQYVYQLNPGYLNYNTVTTNDAFSSYQQLADGTYAYQVPRNSTYSIDIKIPFNISINEVVASGQTVVKAVAILEKNPDPVNATWSFVDRSMFTYVEQGIYASSYGWQSQRSLIVLDNDTCNNGADSPVKVMCELTGSYNLNANDYVRVSFFLIRLYHFLPFNNVNQARISIKNRFATSQGNIQAGILSFTDTLNSSVVPVTGSNYTLSTFFTVTGSNNNQLKFSDSASILYNKIQFNQDNDLISNNYSPEIYPFNFQVGDIIRLASYYTQNPTYYTVTGVTPPITGSDLLYVTSSLGQNVTSSLLVTLDKPVSSSNSISSKFVIFRRTPDETSVILNFNKTPGITSQAVLVPWDLDQDVHNQVANLVSQLTPQLSSTLTSASGSI